MAALVEAARAASWRLAVGLGGVAPRPLLVELSGLVRRPDQAVLAEVRERVATACDPASDQRGSAGYKRAMAALWTGRALQACLEAYP